MLTPVSELGGLGRARPLWGGTSVLFDSKIMSLRLHGCVLPCFSASGHCLPKRSESLEMECVQASAVAPRGPAALSSQTVLP